VSVGLQAGFALSHCHQQSVEDRLRPGRASRDVDIDGDDTIDSANRRVGGLTEDSPAAPAGAHGHDYPRLGCGFVRPAKSDLHVPRDGSGHEEKVGVPGARDEVDPEALQVEQRIGRGSDFELAPVAAPCVDLPDVQRAPKQAADTLAQERRGFIEPGTGLGFDLAESGATSLVDVE
jgi:hypothetical protein